jgi:hypothetical protein
MYEAEALMRRKERERYLRKRRCIHIYIYIYIHYVQEEVSKFYMEY